jgi:hypothetical protein
MKIAPGAVSPALSDQALAEVNLEPTPEQALLEYTSQNGHFQFLHDRAWHVVNDTPDAVTLRLIERGELIAQCNASAVAPVEAGKRFTLAHFQEDVQKSLDKHFESFLSAGESENSVGHTTCRVIAGGKVESLPIQWNYYLVADSEGHQTVLAFTRIRASRTLRRRRQVDPVHVAIRKADRRADRRDSRPADTRSDAQVDAGPKPCDFGSRPASGGGL